MVESGYSNQKIKKKPRSLTGHKVKRSLITYSMEKKTMRRSVTIEPVLHEFIIELRGWFGMEKHLDVDYTTVLNMLAKLGALRVLKWEELSDKEKGLIENSLEDDPIQKRESALDELWTKHLKVEMPDYDPEPDTEEPQNEGEETEEKEERARA